jgi:hypothetical protein
MKSRAVRRYEMRKEAFLDISKDYPGEPRKIRLAMALDLSKRWYKSRGQSGG